jgi:ubiquinone/menaquinone biosynthesis C-methylase UbiE
MNDYLRQCRARAELFKRCGFDVYASRKFVADCAGDMSGSILEVGTGKGFLTAELARRGVRLTSIDIDGKNLKMAKAVILPGRLKNRIIFKVMDCRALPYRKGSFDCVISIDFFHHLKSPVRCLGEMMRVTRRKLVIADLNKSGADLFERIHAREGRHHERTRMPFPEMKKRLQERGLHVKTYRRDFHTVLVAGKGEGR